MRYLGLLLLMFAGTASADFHYQDCVRIVGGFYFNEQDPMVGTVYAKEVRGNITYYNLGLFLPIWIEESNLKKVEQKVCEEARKHE